MHEAVILLYGVAKTGHVRVHGDITLLFPSVPCPFVGEHTKEGLPRPLTLCHLSSFTNCRDYGDKILVPQD